MPINNYGVWVANPVRVSAERAEADPETPHIHLFYDDGTGGSFSNARRASINVKSSSALSELVFWQLTDFDHPIADLLSGLDMGFTPIPSQPGGPALDYIRGNLVDLATGRVLPHDQPGPKDDIIDFILPELQAAISRNATVYLQARRNGLRLQSR